MRRRSAPWSAAGPARRPGVPAGVLIGGADGIASPRIVERQLSLCSPTAAATVHSLDRSRSSMLGSSLSGSTSVSVSVSCDRSVLVPAPHGRTPSRATATTCVLRRDQAEPLGQRGQRGAQRGRVLPAAIGIARERGHHDVVDLRRHQRVLLRRRQRSCMSRTRVSVSMSSRPANSGRLVSSSCAITPIANRSARASIRPAMYSGAM